MSGPRADTGNTIHQGGGWIRDIVEGAEKEKGKKRKKRDPRRGVTLPNHRDGDKARSDSGGSSDSRKMHLSHLPSYPWPPLLPDCCLNQSLRY